MRVGVIGAGKFASMFLTQALHLPAIHVAGVVDLDPERARSAPARTGWPAERYGAPSLGEALRSGATYVGDSADELLDSAGIEVILEITGSPIAGAYHADRAIAQGRHVIMVNVEADCLIGPVLAERARRNGVVYALAYGDQPALICELVDWCRTAGFDVVAAGKGTKYLPEYHQSTPDTVWAHYGFSEEQLASGDFNPGVFVTFEARTEYAVQCFAEYGLRTDPSGRYASLYRPYHLIGLELAVSIASAVVRGEPTGAPTGFRGDVCAVAKRALRAGETLDGEGGFMVFGRLAPAARSVSEGALPLGLAHGIRLRRDVPAGATLRYADVELDESVRAVRLRRELEATLAVEVR